MNSKNIRTQLRLLQPLLKNCSLDTLRRGQNLVGELMESKYRRQVLVSGHDFDDFEGAWIIPSGGRDPVSAWRRLCLRQSGVRQGIRFHAGPSDRHPGLLRSLSAGAGASVSGSVGRCAGKLPVSSVQGLRPRAHHPLR